MTTIKIPIPVKGVDDATKDGAENKESRALRGEEVKATFTPEERDEFLRREEERGKGKDAN